MKLPNYNEICHLEGSMNYTVIHLNDGKKQVSACTLKQYEILLSESENFIRIHKSYIVNRSYIKEIRLKPQNTVVLLSGIELPIARRRKLEMNFI